MSIGQILLIATLILLNAFFVGVEFAVVASRRSRFDGMISGDNRAAELVRRWLEDTNARDRLVAASQLGITLVSLTLGAVSKDAFEAWLEPYFHEIVLPANLQFLSATYTALPLMISLAVVTSFHVVLGEQVPKAAVLRAPEKFAVRSAPVMQLFINIFRGFLFLLEAATRLVLKLLRLPSGDSHSTVLSTEERKQIISGPEVKGVIEPPERQMLSAVIDFGELVARQISIPRTEILAVESTCTIGEAIGLAAANGFTKLPVYEDNLDQIVGLLHLKDLLPTLLEEEMQSRPVRDLTREALFVPESISVNDLLLQMRVLRQHMAITLDEFGGTAGLVTLEDLLEEIVGDVQDPFDEAPPTIEMVGEHEAMIDGLAQMEEVNNHFGLNLLDPNYDTIAGYLLGRLGRMAQIGDEVEDEQGQVRLRVESLDRLRIARIRLSRL